MRCAEVQTAGPCSRMKLNNIGYYRPKQEMIREFKKLSEFAARHKVRLEPKALRKLTDILTGKEKPTRETLDRLALLAGFQSWESLKKTFEE